MKTLRITIHRITAALILMGFMLSSCNASQEAMPIEAGEPLPPTPTPVIDEQSTPTDVQPREGLHATDPSTVNLAVGDLQLVEFFAFW
jgi:hypothetical protein